MTSIAFPHCYRSVILSEGKCSVEMSSYEGDNHIEHPRTETSHPLPLSRALSCVSPGSQHKPSEEHHIHTRFVHSGTRMSLRRADAACRSQASATCSSGTISLSTVQRPAAACARIWVRAWAFCSWVSALLV